MKLHSALPLFALLVAVAVAEEANRIPLPRTRLDSSGRAVAPTPVAATSKDNGSNAVLMEKVVVKEEPLRSPDGPTQPAPAKGKFTVLDGGNLLMKDRSALRFEAGLWAYDDIFGKDAQFKPQPNQANFGLFRMTW